LVEKLAMGGSFRQVRESYRSSVKSSALSVIEFTGGAQII
jgi:hypothetical protein